MSDPVRAAFEAWFETSGMLIQIDKFHREPNAPDEYYDPVTQLTWDGYRAGRAAALEEAAKACDAEVSEIAKTDGEAMSEARKLLPCPFCGGTPMYCQNNEPDGENYGGEWIECSACHACTNIRWPLMESVKELLAVAWNRRTMVKP